MRRVAFVSLFLVACGGGAAPVAPANDDTLEAHVRAHDDEGLRRALAALDSKTESERLRGLRATLEYDPVKLAASLDALAARFSRAADAEEKSAAAWALVHAGDVRAASAALALYDAGTLSRATKLDGSSAYDAVMFARLLSAATVPSEERATRRNVIMNALSLADKATRPLLARALAEDDASDGATLVAAAESLDARADFVTIEHLFQRVRALADPRAADALARYASHAMHPHFRTEAALRLAELGDLRAAPHLAWRLGEDPQALYDASDPNLIAHRRTDAERIACARMLAELATMHPEARAELREMTDAPLAAWYHERPHANAMRLLVALESPRAVSELKAWADPSTPIPGASDQSFPEAFAVAQSALRYLGKTRDASAFAILQKQLARKPAAFDASALTSGAQAKGAVAGMVYRALAYGAAEGFSELGDPKAVPLLTKIADDAKQDDQARVVACAAASYLSDAKARGEIVSQLRATATDRRRETWRGCWLAGLVQRPNAVVDAPLVALIAPKVDPESRHLAARLLGQGGLAAQERDKLLALTNVRPFVHDATLAILFGGDADSIAKALSAYESKDEAPEREAAPIEPLRQLYAQSVPVLTEDLFDSGALARIARLAVAARDVTVRGQKQEWVLQSLAYQLRQSGELAGPGVGDAGPHSLTRVRLRAKLVADAKGQDAKKRDDALTLLWLLGERATLQALGATAKLAEPSP